MFITKIKTTVLLLCIVCISENIFSQAFGGVRVKTGASQVLPECDDDLEVSFSLEFLLDIDQLDCDHPFVSVTVDGETSFFEIESSVIEFELDLSYAYPAGECVGLYTPELEFDLYCLVYDPSTGSYEFESYEDMTGTAYGTSASVDVCICPGPPPPPPPPPPGLDNGGLRQGTDKAFEDDTNLLSDKSDAEKQRNDIQNFDFIQTFETVIVRDQSGNNFDSKLSVKDVNGNEVLTSGNSNMQSVTFEISSLPAGYYIVHGTINGEPYVKAFIKM